MTIPKKKTVTPDPQAVEAFISGTKSEQAEQPQQQAITPAAVTLVKTRKKPARQKEVVTRQTFVCNAGLISKLEALAFWGRLTKKAVLEQALTQFFEGKKIRPIPRQEQEQEQE